MISLILQVDILNSISPLLQKDKTYFTYENFESNPPSTVNTAKFDCLDLSGPPCTVATS